MITFSQLIGWGMFVTLLTTFILVCMIYTYAYKVWKPSHRRT